jgi:hypothetical protein
MIGNWTLLQGRRSQRSDRSSGTGSKVIDPVYGLAQLGRLLLLEGRLYPWGCNGDGQPAAHSDRDGQLLTVRAEQAVKCPSEDPTI